MKRKVFSVWICIMVLFTTLSCQLFSAPNSPAATTAATVEAASITEPAPTATVDAAATTRAADQSAKATKDAAATVAAKEKAQTATQAAVARRTEQAITRVARTATAVGKATAQAADMVSLVKQLKSEDILESDAGKYFLLEDFGESLAQINYYRPFPTGHNPTDFVIRTHTSWESASRTANWFNSGCGFVFRLVDGDNHYMIYLALDGNVYMSGYVKGRFREFGKDYVGKIDYMKGEADIVMVVQGDRVVYYVNGTKVFDRRNDEISYGDLAMTLVSGTNKDFGTRCEMTNIELWELDPR